MLLKAKTPFVLHDISARRLLIGSISFEMLNAAFASACDDDVVFVFCRVKNYARVANCSS